MSADERREDVVDALFKKYMTFLERCPSLFIGYCKLEFVQPTVGAMRLFAFAMALGAVDRMATERGVSPEDVVKPETHPETGYRFVEDEWVIEHSGYRNKVTLDWVHSEVFNVMRFRAKIAADVQSGLDSRPTA